MAFFVAALEDFGASVFLGAAAAATEVLTSETFGASLFLSEEEL